MSNNKVFIAILTSYSLSKYRMKKILLSVASVLLSVYCMAQEPVAFPFQGGRDVMNQFFKDSIVVAPQIIQEKATGTVIFKFTADDKGNISKIVVYYADDAVLVTSVADALKKSNHKWIIPNHQKFNDFILPVSYSFNKPNVENDELLKSVYDYTQIRKPIFATDQVPLNSSTLLPAITINYDIPQ